MSFVIKKIMEQLINMLHGAERRVSEKFSLKVISHWALRLFGDSKLQESSNLQTSD